MSPKARPDAPSYRPSRPTDILNPPAVPRSSRSLAALPDSWQVALTEAEEWPYVDPDENGLADPEPDFNDYPTDPALLPADIIPFSEDEPWGQMVTENSRNYAMFCHYRAQGITRTYQAVAEQFNLNRTYVSELARKKNWNDRVRAWDTYRERVYTAELILGVKEMAHKHAEIARDGIEALAVAFTGIIEAMGDEDSKAAFLAEIAEMPVKSQLLLAQSSARVIPGLMNAERLSRGLPTEISEQHITSDSRVIVQTTDDLYEILTGLAGPLAITQSEPTEEEVIDAE